MRTRSPLAPPAPRQELARREHGEHSPPAGSPTAHRARTEDDRIWRDAQSLLLPRHDCVAAEPMRVAVTNLQLASVRMPDRAALDQCLIAAGSWFRVAKAPAPVAGDEITEWGRFRLALPPDGEVRAIAILGLLPWAADPDTAWLLSLLGRAAWRAGEQHREAIDRLVHWTLRRSWLASPEGPRALGADDRTSLEMPRRDRDWCAWHPDSAAAMPQVSGPHAPCFVLESLPGAAVELRAWLRERDLVD